MRLKWYRLAATLIFLLQGTIARADYQFKFADSSGNFLSSFSVNQGSTIDIRVYLTQSGSDTGLSNSPSQGLNTGGVKLTYDGTVTNVASAANITPNAAFDSSSKSVTANSATLNVFKDSGAVFAPTSGADANRILLGTFTFTGVSPGSSLTLTADPHSPGADNVLGDGTSLDALILNSSAVITVVAVPEPGTLVLCGVLGSGGMCFCWRRRRAQASV